MMEEEMKHLEEERRYRQKERQLRRQVAEKAAANDPNPANKTSSMEKLKEYR